MSKITKNKEWMNVQEIADYFGLSTKTVYRDIKLGTLPVSRIGGGVIRINAIQRRHYQNAQK